MWQILVWITCTSELLRNFEELFEKQNLILYHKKQNLDSLYNEVSFYMTKMWLFMQYFCVMCLLLK